MSGRVFLDTNVLIYAASSQGYPAKYARAEQIIAANDFAISTQVVGEFVRNVQSPKKMSPPLGDDEVDHWVDWLFEFPVIAVDREIILDAMVLQRRYQIDFWDSQILAAAHRFGAEVLYSEDLNHGQTYGAVRCENPFRSN